VATLDSSDRRSSAAAALPPAAQRSLRPLADALTGKSGWIAAAALCAAYVICMVRLTSFPMQDYANHVARAKIMADLVFDHGAQFGRYFELHLAAVPYVLPDLLQMSAVELFGAEVGTGIFTALVLLSLPCALLFYARACQLPRGAWLFVLLVGLVLSTDWFFLVGFFAFRLALAFIVVTLALAEILRRRWSTAGYVAHVIVLGLGYLTHLTALAFIAVALGVSALVRLRLKSTTLRREVYLLAPVALLFIFYIGFAAPRHEGSGAFSFDWVAPSVTKFATSKIRNLPDEFSAFDWHLATQTLILLGIAALWPVRRQLSRATLAKPDVIEQLVLVVAFIGVYLALPGDYQDADYVDIRALPMVSLLLLFALLRLPDERSVGQTFGSPSALALAGLLAVVNLLSVTRALDTNNSWIDRYRQVVAAIPRGAVVLPVHTETRLQHLLHVASNAVVDRDAIIPYLFSAENHDPMTYFHYRHQIYAPDGQWYRGELRGSASALNAVDWNQVACDYDFLLVTMPYDARLIRVPNKLVTSNAEAALLAIDKDSCSGVPRAAHPARAGADHSYAARR
jgi:hypothetical protein